jgi:HSP20 family molecular chaperone IbpA
MFLSELEKIGETLESNLTEFRKNFGERMRATLTEGFGISRQIDVAFEDNEEGYFVVISGLQGILKEDLELEFFGSTLTVSGSCKQNIGGKDLDGGYSCEEYNFSFKKVISLNIPEGVTVLNAKFDDFKGVLRVKFPSRKPKVNTEAFKITIE